MSGHVLISDPLNVSTVQNVQNKMGFTNYSVSELVLLTTFEARQEKNCKMVMKKKVFFFFSFLSSFLNNNNREKLKDLMKSNSVKYMCSQ